MKKDKAKTNAEDDLRAEYDFSKLKGAVRGKYYKQITAGVDLVRFTLVPVPTELVPEVREFIDRRQKSPKRSRTAVRPGRSK
jgi:hypothetical protein